MTADILSIVRPGSRGLVNFRLLDQRGHSITAFWTDRAPRSIAPDRHYLYSPGLRAYRANRVLGSWCVWADVDGVHDAAQLVLPLPASAIVWSGRNGFHVYWAVDRFLDAGDLAPLLVGVASAVGGDPAAARISQHLRWPGSHNCKAGGGLCSFVDLSPHLRYSLTELLNAFPVPVALDAPPPPSGGPRWVTTGDKFSRVNALLLSGGSLGDYISQTAGRVSAGRYLCPWHEDANASVSVDNRRGLWFCHACRVGGDALEWYCRVNQCSKGQALARLLPSNV